MIEFPPEFYGMVSALWSTYQYTILIWMLVMFAGVALLALGIVISNVVRLVWDA